MTVGLGFIKVPLGLRLGGESQNSHGAMEVRLIDASTGQVLQSHRVEGNRTPPVFHWSWTIAGPASAASISAKLPSARPPGRLLSRPSA
jgi:hypothetical protein